MTRLIGHGTWLLDQQRFFAWAESPTLTPLRGRKPKLPPHPFAASAEQLLAALELSPDHTPTTTLTIWLPTADGRPLPSPELLATGALEPPTAQPELKPWRVTGMLIELEDLRELLWSLLNCPGLHPAAYRCAPSRMSAGINC